MKTVMTTISGIDVKYLSCNVASVRLVRYLW